MNDQFGINMKAYCREHEAMVRSAVDEGRVTAELMAMHRDKTLILQHERLVHLIVTVMTVFAELFMVDLVLLHPELGVIPAVIMLGFAILLMFYFLHYFFLENTVQRWYKLTDIMHDQLRKR